MKKNFKWIIVAVLAIISMMFVLTGCGKNKEITLTGVTYTAVVVEGSNLDLSTGKLSYKQGDDYGQVALNAEGVSVTGYDKNVVGEQTLTVTYKEKSVTFKVNVLKGLIVEGVKTEYISGEQIDVNTGSLKVVQADGTYVNVALNDAAVTITGFDTTTGGNKTVTVNYNNGSISYSTTYTITVSEITVKIKYPNKTTYKSYDTELDLAGGYLTVTANGKDSYVFLADPKVTVEGFDLSVVSSENPVVSQTISITYLGTVYKYEIEIKYSPVSWMKDLIVEFNKKDWMSKEAPEFTEQEAEDAIEAYTLYTGLEAAEKAFVSEAEAKVLRRAAVIVAYDKWYTEAQSYSETFVVGYSSITLGCKSYEKTKSDYERLKAEDAKIHFYSGIIFEIAELYINETLYGNTTMIEHIGAMYVDEVYEQILPVLSYMITLHETLAPVSENWTVEELLSQHSKAIEDAKDIIYNGNFTSYNFVFLHDLVSAWRIKNDYFEIIYSYYYFGGEELRSQITNMFQRVPLPADLQDIYMSIADGHTYANSLSQEGSEWIDTTTIFKSYFDIQKAKKKLDESGSELSKGLYEFLNMDFFILNNLVYRNNAIQRQSRELYGDARFNQLWQEYVALFDLVKSDGTIDMKLNSETILDVFKLFVNATPSWQYSFIASMHNSYREVDYYTWDEILAIDYTTYLNSNFTMLYSDFFATMLSYEDGEETVEYKEAQKLVIEMFRAIELYALRYRFDVALGDFQKVMVKAIDMHEHLPTVQRDAFDDLIGFAYEKYVGIYQRSISNNDVYLGDLEETFVQLESTLKEFFVYNKTINSNIIEEAEKAKVRPLFIASYEVISSLAETIIANGNKEMLNYFYVKEYVINEDLTSTLEYAYWKARETFIDEMVNVIAFQIVKDGKQYIYPAWEVYYPTNTNLLLVQVYDVMKAQYNGEVATADQVVAAMAAYRAADEASQKMFWSLDCDALYFAGIDAFFATCSDDIKAVADKLVAAEKAYYNYAQETENEELMEAFKTAFEEVDAVVDGVSDTTAYETLLNDMYDFYQIKYNELG